MSHINKNKMGLTLGSLMGFWHFLWSVVVALGYGPKLVEFAFQRHFIQPPFTVTPFDYVMAAELIGITFIGGYIFGWLFGAVWNRLHANP